MSINIFILPYFKTNLFDDNFKLVLNDILKNNNKNIFLFGKINQKVIDFIQNDSNSIALFTIDLNNNIISINKDINFSEILCEQINKHTFVNIQNKDSFLTQSSLNDFTSICFIDNDIFNSFMEQTKEKIIENDLQKIKTDENIQSQNKNSLSNLLTISDFTTMESENQITLEEETSQESSQALEEETSQQTSQQLGGNSLSFLNNSYIDNDSFQEKSLNISESINLHFPSKSMQMENESLSTNLNSESNNSFSLKNDLYFTSLESEIKSKSFKEFSEIFS